MKRVSYALVCILFAAAPNAHAQKPEDRFELGQRLRAFETTLEAQQDAEARKRALVILKPATMTFLLGRSSDAARILDRARFALASDKEPAAEDQWAAALFAQPRARLLDAAAEELFVTIKAFYVVKNGRPEKPRVRLSLLDAGKAKGESVTVDLGDLPFETKLPLKNLKGGDYTVRCEILQGDKVLTTADQSVSFVKHLDERLAQLQTAVKDLEKKERTTDVTTLVALVNLLAKLEGKEPQETNYPAARLLDEAESLVAALKAGEPFYGRKKPGQFWLNLATERAAPVRLLAPEASKKGEPLPLVIVLHGAGGSENMFFDAYGHGLVVKLCEERGWLLVATRNGQIAGVVEEVNKLYPVDKKRILIIGHSMGAAQAVAAASANPEQYIAVAALGGGGGIKASNALKEVAFFVGVGKEDFALQGARSLKESLKKADIKALEMKEYPDLEHITVVQLGLRDVFAFFDEVVKKKASERD